MTVTHEVQTTATLAGRIRVRRELLGWNKKQLAGLAGLHQSHISVLEHSGRTEVRPSTVTKLATALGVTEAWLLHGTDDRPVPPESPYLPVVWLAAENGITPSALRKVVEAMIATREGGLEPWHIHQTPKGRSEIQS